MYLATFWTVRTAQAALPGDAVYPFKQWMREQRMSLSPADQRIEVIAITKKNWPRKPRRWPVVQNARSDARAELSIENTEAMVYYGHHGDLLMIGPFLVAPNYQPVAGVEEFETMAIRARWCPAPSFS